MNKDRRAAQIALGEEIQELIETSGIQKKLLYTKLGVAKKTLDNWINGVYSPSFFEMLEIRFYCTVGAKKEELRKLLAKYGISVGRSN